MKCPKCKENMVKYENRQDSFSYCINSKCLFWGLRRFHLRDNEPRKVAQQRSR